ncbi:Uncharacterized protein PBTT_07403 [Plasmodiophora brassicae]
MDPIGERLDVDGADAQHVPMCVFRCGAQQHVVAVTATGQIQVFDPRTRQRCARADALPPSDLVAIAESHEWNVNEHPSSLVTDIDDAVGLGGNLLSASGGPPTVTSVAASSDGFWISTSDARLQFWVVDVQASLAAVTCRNDMRPGASFVHMAYSGNTLWTVTSDLELATCDVRLGAPANATALPSAAISKVNVMRAVGEQVWLGGPPAGIRVYDEVNHLVASLDTNGNEVVDVAHVEATGTVWCAYRCGSIAIWDADVHVCTTTITGSDPIAVIRSAGADVVTVSATGNVAVWDTRNYAARQTLPNAMATIRDVYVGTDAIWVLYDAPLGLQAFRFQSSPGSPPVYTDGGDAEQRPSCAAEQNGMAPATIDTGNRSATSERSRWSAQEQKLLEMVRMSNEGREQAIEQGRQAEERLLALVDSVNRDKMNAIQEHQQERQVWRQTAFNLQRDLTEERAKHVKERDALQSTHNTAVQEIQARLLDALQQNDDLRAEIDAIRRQTSSSLEAALAENDARWRQELDGARQSAEWASAALRQKNADLRRTNADLLQAATEAQARDKQNCRQIAHMQQLVQAATLRLSTVRTAFETSEGLRRQENLEAAQASNQIKSYAEALQTCVEQANESVAKQKGEWQAQMATLQARARKRQVQLGIRIDVLEQELRNATSANAKLETTAAQLLDAKREIIRLRQAIATAEHERAQACNQVADCKRRHRSPGRRRRRRPSSPPPGQAEATPRPDPPAGPGTAQ